MGKPEVKDEKNRQKGESKPSAQHSAGAAKMPAWVGGISKQALVSPLLQGEVP